MLRDAEHHELTREVSELRFGPYFAAYEAALGSGCNAGQRALLRLGLSFFTWRTLVREGGLTPKAAAERMAKAITG